MRFIYFFLKNRHFLESDAAVNLSRKVMDGLQERRAL